MRLSEGIFDPIPSHSLGLEHTMAPSIHSELATSIQETEQGNIRAGQCLSIQSPVVALLISPKGQIAFFLFIAIFFPQLLLKVWSEKTLKIGPEG